MSPELFEPALFARALRQVKSYVLQNCGTIPDAEDIMQDGLLIFFQSKSKKDLILSTNGKPNQVACFFHFAWHKKISTTEKYLQSGLEELQAAIEKHHPLG